jgi:hypothetical protein
VTYELIRQMGVNFPVIDICEAPGVSRAAYYRCLSGQTYHPNKHKQKQIRVLEYAFWNHKKLYGSRRLAAEPEKINESMGRYRVRKVMQQPRLKAIQPGSFVPRTADLPVKSCI